MGWRGGCPRLTTTSAETCCPRPERCILFPHRREDQEKHSVKRREFIKLFRCCVGSRFLSMAKFRYKREMGKAFPDISGSINADDRRAFDAYREVAARRGARLLVRQRHARCNPPAGRRGRRAHPRSLRPIVPMIRSFLTVSTGTLASRLLGFLRDALIAALLGAGPVADAFLAAFQLVNVARRLLERRRAQRGAGAGLAARPRNRGRGGGRRVCRPRARHDQRGADRRARCCSPC